MGLIHLETEKCEKEVLNLFIQEIPDTQNITMPLKIKI
jgi:hypothetical protein